MAQQQPFTMPVSVPVGVADLGGAEHLASSGSSSSSTSAAAAAGANPAEDEAVLHRATVAEANPTAGSVTAYLVSYVFFLIHARVKSHYTAICKY